MRIAPRSIHLPTNDELSFGMDSPESQGSSINSVAVRKCGTVNIHHAELIEDGRALLAPCTA